jgi:hypothetical protein
MPESSSRHPEPVPSADPRADVVHADRNLPRRYWRLLVGVWLLARRRAYATLSAVIVVLTVAAVVQPNIDGREHATAMLVGLAIAVAQSCCESWKRGHAVGPAFNATSLQLPEPRDPADCTTGGEREAVPSDHAVPTLRRSYKVVS